MRELEPWEVEAPLPSGFYVWERRERDLIEGWSEWRIETVFEIKDDTIRSLNPNPLWDMEADEEHQHYLKSWESARRAKEREPKRDDPEAEPLEKIRGFIQEAYARVDYRLLSASEEEADRAAQALFEEQLEAEPRFGDWFVLVGERPDKEDEFTHAAYGKIVDIQDDWRVIFEVYGVKEDPSLLVVTEDEVHHVDPATWEPDLSRRVRTIGEIELGGLYSYWTDNPEEKLFGLREVHKTEIPSLKRLRKGWKHLKEDLSGRRNLGCY